MVIFSYAFSATNFNLPILPEDKFQGVGYDRFKHKTNGEMLFVSGITYDNMVVFDVGANRGAWTDMLLQTGCSFKALHLFEPIPSLYGALCEKYKMGEVFVNNLALSNTSEERKFIIYDRDTLSSFYNREIYKDMEKRTINVQCEKIDSYCARNDIETIDLLKIDAEGAEKTIIEGAKNKISKGEVSIIFFEYGKCYHDAKTKLRDVYTFLRSKYDLYRIAPFGLLHIPMWEERLENYRYSNYVAIKKSKH